MCRLIILSILFCAALAAPKVGRNVPLPDGRIVGGKPIDISSAKYQVGLLYNGEQFCGGSIIAEKFILTAAHCTDGIPAYKIKVHAGSNYATDGGTVADVLNVFQHPYYDDYNMDNDISILELEEELAMSNKIGIIPITDRQPLANDPAAVSGWGLVEENGDSSDKLLQVEVSVLSTKTCSAKYGTNKITNNMICAAAPGKDSCQGDSGGPLVSKKQLIGVVSWGYGCADPGYPGVYTNVYKYQDWIKAMIDS